jgi:uncharacterized protein involved in exopolysaccharide biosynthesis
MARNTGDRGSRDTIGRHGSFRILGSSDWLRGPQLVIACTLVAAFAAFVLSISLPKQYVAEASVSVRDPIFDPYRVAVTDTPPPREITGTETNFRLVSIETAAQQAAQVSGGRLTSDEIADGIELEGADDSDAITINATARSPVHAALVANAFAASYVELWRNANQLKIERATRETGPQVLAEGLVPGEASLLQPATVQGSRLIPRRNLATLLGGALGLFLGLALAALRGGKGAQVLRMSSSPTD